MVLLIDSRMLERLDKLGFDSVDEELCFSIGITWKINNVSHAQYKVTGGKFTYANPHLLS